MIIDQYIKCSKTTAEEDSKSSIAKCSFCHKTTAEVKVLISGPSGVYICNECIDICNDIIKEDNHRR